MNTICRSLSIASAFAVPVLSLFIAATASGRPEAARAERSRVTIMTWNVENLFDTIHDDGKEDFTYLPLATKRQMPGLEEACQKMSTDFFRKECLESDWSDAVVEEKLSRMVDVITQVGDGRGPDIQILVEVENQRVLEQLRDRLPGSGYKTAVLLEGRDERGIDNAVLSRFEQWDEPRIHFVPFKTNNPQDEKAATSTRGILEVRLLLPGGQKASVFALHLPSQSNPTYLRQQAVQHLNVLKAQLPADVIAIAGGDFNITRKEDTERQYVSGILASQWQVSHLIGCKDCTGSHFFPKEDPQFQWSFLDLLLFDTKNSNDWKVDATAIRTPNASRFQNNLQGKPLHFTPGKDFGISDHWPMYAELYR